MGHGNSSGLEASHGSPSPPAPPAPHVPPPGDGGDGGDSGDGRPPADEPSSDDSEDEGGAEPTIGQRLNCANRGRRPHVLIGSFRASSGIVTLSPWRRSRVTRMNPAERRKLRGPLRRRCGGCAPITHQLTATRRSAHPAHPTMRVLYLSISAAWI
eukprot:4626357-Prymnesium_polylepis.1